MTFLTTDLVRRPSGNDCSPDDGAAVNVTPRIFLLPVPVSGVSGVPGVSGVSALTGSAFRGAVVSGGTAAKFTPFVSFLPAPTKPAGGEIAAGLPILSFSGFHSGGVAEKFNPATRLSPEPVSGTFPSRVSRCMLKQ